MSELKDEVESSLHKMFAQLQKDIQEFLPNENIRLYDNHDGEPCIFGYHDSLSLEESEFEIDTIGRKKLVNGWSITKWVINHGYPHEPDGVDAVEVGYFRTEVSARLAFLKAIFACKMEDYAQRLYDIAFAKQQEEWEKIENQM